MKFLGVLIDENLTWKEDINCISLRISKSIGILNSLKYNLPLKILVNSYNSMILSHLTYINIVWGIVHHIYYRNCFYFKNVQYVQYLDHMSYRTHENCF